MFSGGDKFMIREPGDKPFPWRCTNCLQKTVVKTTIPYSATVAHDGRSYEVNIPSLTIPQCSSCSELVFTNHVDEQINDALRDQLHLLSPVEIRQQRKMLQLSQKQLSNFLGVAEASISRWENSVSIQSRALDKLLRLFFDFPAVRDRLVEQYQSIAGDISHLPREGAIDLKSEDDWSTLFPTASSTYGNSAINTLSMQVVARQQLFVLGKE